MYSHSDSIKAKVMKMVYTILQTTMVYSLKVKNKKESPHERAGQPQMYCNTEATLGEAEASFTPPKNSKIILTAVGLCPVRAVKL